MCRLAARDGIHTIVATPHVNPGLYDPPKEVILSKVAELNRILQNLPCLPPKRPRTNLSRERQSLFHRDQTEQTSLRILPGSDIHLDSLLSRGLKMEELLFINGNHKYILLELPDYILLNPVKYFIADLRQKGIIPIISHPERNPLLQDNMELLADFIRLGALSQITAMSITGEFGKKARDLAHNFLRLDLAHVIASDAHSSYHRPPVLSRACAEAAKIIGREKAWKMVGEIPLAIIEEKTFEIPEPKV